MTDGPRGRGAEAVQAAQRLMAGKDWRDEARLDVVIRRLTAVEQELAGAGEDVGEVFVHLALLLGTRCHLRYQDGRLDPAERAAALERPRRIDRHASLPPGLPTQARMLFVLLLVPWALPRPDGTRTALQHALLRAVHGKVLTEALRRDLTGAREVTGRLIGTPAGEEFRRQCESNRQDIERMPAAVRPTESALRLAVPSGAPAGAERLTVAGILDGPTSVMTAVLHHHLTEGCLAPPDALRADQLWMLDPHREPPPTLTGPLRGEATRPDLHELCHWAAFTHQGNPASGRPISLA
ncbi:hypothetical protein ABWI13_03325 [Streptomyces koyangensis]|uniref:hypothetical protein n=1 Tax=Streptomyces koyangensis TaxID=188770 RepID=UPI00337550F3